MDVSRANISMGGILPEAHPGRSPSPPTARPPPPRKSDAPAGPLFAHLVAQAATVFHWQIAPAGGASSPRSFPLLPVFAHLLAHLAVVFRRRVAPMPCCACAADRARGPRNSEQGTKSVSWWRSNGGFRCHCPSGGQRQGHRDVNDMFPGRAYKPCYHLPHRPRTAIIVARMNEQHHHILVVDDDARLRDLLTRYLGEQGFEVKAAADGQQMDKGARPRALPPDRPRPDDARRGWPVDLPPPARPGRPDPDHHAHRQGDEVDRIVGLGNGRRRLSAQTLQPARTARPHHAVLRRQGNKAARRAGERCRHRPFAISRSISPPAR